MFDCFSRKQNKRKVSHGIFDCFHNVQQVVRSFSQLSTPLEFFPSTCWPNSIVGTLEVPKTLWSPVVNHKYKHIWFCCSEKSEDSYIEVEYIYQPLVNTPSLIRKKNASIFWMNFFGGEFRAPQTLLGDNVQAKNISAPLNHTGIMIPGFFRIPIRRVAPSSLFQFNGMFLSLWLCMSWMNSTKSTEDLVQPRFNSCLVTAVSNHPPSFSTTWCDRGYC